MTRIGLLSDTHSYLDDAVFEHFKDCDEIWHAGDIGNHEIFEKLSAFKPTRAVFGNIDTFEMRAYLPENLFFEIEKLKVFITHIGGLPPKYTTKIKDLINKQQTNLFICGHSHILRVIKDTKIDRLVYLNPGAAGKHGFHKVRTLMRMDLEAGKISNLEVIELGIR
jgi:uncharacterized protein